MPRVRPTEDIRPLAEFRAHLASVLRQVRRTKRPVILTQHGRSAAVLSIRLSTKRSSSGPNSWKMSAWPSEQWRPADRQRVVVLTIRDSRQLLDPTELEAAG